MVALRWGGLAALGLDEANVREERGETRPGELTVPGPRGGPEAGTASPGPGQDAGPRLLSRATGWSVRPSHSCAHRNVGGVVPGGLARRGAGLGRCGDEVALRAARESDGGGTGGREAARPAAQRGRRGPRRHQRPLAWGSRQVAASGPLDAAETRHTRPRLLRTGRRLRSGGCVKRPPGLRVRCALLRRTRPGTLLCTVGFSSSIIPLKQFSQVRSLVQRTETFCSLRGINCHADSQEGQARSALAAAGGLTRPPRSWVLWLRFFFVNSRHVKCYFKVTAVVSVFLITEEE